MLVVFTNILGLPIGPVLKGLIVMSKRRKTMQYYKSQGLNYTAAKA